MEVDPGTTAVTLPQIALDRLAHRIKGAGGRELEERCLPRQYPVVEGTTPEENRTSGCGAKARFELPDSYAEVGESSGTLVACALDDAAFLWPRLRRG